MTNKKLFGAKNDSEADVVGFVEDGNPSEVTHAAFIAATYKGNNHQPEAKRVGIMKIRDHLREMGFKRATSYKSDEQTIAGIYSDLSAGFALYKA